MQRVAQVYQNKDGTWTVRVGIQVEHINGFGKTPGEIFEAIRYALISKGVVLEDVELIEMMRQETLH